MNTDFEKLNGRAFPMKLDKDGTLVLKLYTGEIERFSSNPQNLENLYNLADYNIKFGSNKINPENVKKIKIISELDSSKDFNRMIQEDGLAHERTLETELRNMAFIGKTFCEKLNIEKNIDLKLVSDGSINFALMDNLESRDNFFETEIRENSESMNITTRCGIFLENLIGSNANFRNNFELQNLDGNCADFPLQHNTYYSHKAAAEAMNGIFEKPNEFITNIAMVGVKKPVLREARSKEVEYEGRRLPSEVFIKVVDAPNDESNGIAAINAELLRFQNYRYKKSELFNREKNQAFKSGNFGIKVVDENSKETVFMAKNDDLKFIIGNGNKKERISFSDNKDFGKYSNYILDTKKLTEKMGMTTNGYSKTEMDNKVQKWINALTR